MEFAKFIFKPRARSCAQRGFSAKENTTALRKINLRPLLGTTSSGKNPHTTDAIRLNRWTKYTLSWIFRGTDKIQLSFFPR